MNLLLIFFYFTQYINHILTIDDKKLSGVLKKMALTNLNGVEEVNIFKADGNVIHILSPKSKFLLLKYHNNLLIF